MDHGLLPEILNLAEVSERLARCRLRLLEFEFNVKHRSGVKLQGANAFLRLLADGTDKTGLANDVSIVPFYNASFCKRWTHVLENTTIAMMHVNKLPGDYKLPTIEEFIKTKK